MLVWYWVEVGTQVQNERMINRQVVVEARYESATHQTLTEAQGVL